MKIRLAADLQPDSIVDGEGIRTVLWTQGCPHACKGCHNPETHDFSAGRIADTKQILEEIFSNPILSGVTFSGGEPFCQPEALVPMAEVIKKEGKHLMIGYLFKNFGIEGYWRVDPISKNENVTYNFTPYSVEEIIENSYWY